jgi:hypothetical protein
MNKSKILIPAILLILVPITIQAQKLVNGIIKDAYTHQALADANIVETHLHSGTSTNSKGRFSIYVPEDRPIILQVTHIGYRVYEYTLNTENHNKEIVINLIPQAIVIDPVIITATLNRRKVSTLPGRVAVLGKAETEMLPANNTDDLLQGIANVNINRPWGIFSKGASVTMRGLPGSARTLVLIDGIPMNKVSGGTINWNFIQSGDINKIEVVKGPGSALYGNNAMGGVINMTTSHPEKAMEGRIRAFGGSMGHMEVPSSWEGQKKQMEKDFTGTEMCFTGQATGIISNLKKPVMRQMLKLDWMNIIWALMEATVSTVIILWDFSTIIITVLLEQGLRFLKMMDPGTSTGVT